MSRSTASVDHLRERRLVGIARCHFLLGERRRIAFAAHVRGAAPEGRQRRCPASSTRSCSRICSSCSRASICGDFRLRVCCSATRRRSRASAAAAFGLDRAGRDQLHRFPGRDSSSAAASSSGPAPPRGPRRAAPSRRARSAWRGASEACSASISARRVSSMARRTSAQRRCSPSASSAPLFGRCAGPAAPRDARSARGCAPGRLLPWTCRAAAASRVSAQRDRAAARSALSRAEAASAASRSACARSHVSSRSHCSARRCATRRVPRRRGAPCGPHRAPAASSVTRGSRVARPRARRAAARAIVEQSLVEVAARAGAARRARLADRGRCARDASQITPSSEITSPARVTHLQPGGSDAARRSAAPISGTHTTRSRRRVDLRLRVAPDRLGQAAAATLPCCRDDRAAGGSAAARVAGRAAAADHESSLAFRRQEWRGVIDCEPDRALPQVPPIRPAGTSPLPRALRRRGCRRALARPVASPSSTADSSARFERAEACVRAMRPPSRARRSWSASVIEVADAESRGFACAVVGGLRRGLRGTGRLELGDRAVALGLRLGELVP